LNLNNKKNKKGCEKIKRGFTGPVKKRRLPGGDEKRIKERMKAEDHEATAQSPDLRRRGKRKKKGGFSRRNFHLEGCQGPDFFKKAGRWDQERFSKNSIEERSLRADNGEREMGGKGEVGTKKQKLGGTL